MGLQRLVVRNSYEDGAIGNNVFKAVSDQTMVFYLHHCMQLGMILRALYDALQDIKPLAY